jgi:hypothetical protein
MTNDQPLILSGNVVVVEYDDTTARPGSDLMSTLGDPSETIQLEGLDSETVEQTPWRQIRSLFGAWAESGEEDQDLDTLYESRLLASSLSND